MPEVCPDPGATHPTVVAALATLRIMAEQMDCKEDRDILREVADQLECDPLGMCCAVCEEVACDAHCPMAELRAHLVA